MHLHPQKPGFELMVVSHPGWYRFGLSSRTQWLIDLNLSVICEKMNGSSHKIKGGTQNLVKHIYLPLGGENGTRYLFDEVQAERAMIAANKEKIPIIITVPAIRIAPNRYEVRNNLSNTFIPYVEYLNQQYGPLFALPTQDWGGTIRSYEKRAADVVDRCMDTLLARDWSIINFAGGQIDACLSSTLYDFAHARNVQLIDDFCSERNAVLTHTRKAKSRAKMLVAQHLLRGDKKSLHQLHTLLAPERFAAKEQYTYAMKSFIEAGAPYERLITVVGMKPDWWR
jgi:hypothetical protein